MTREIVLDTETTGLDPNYGHRIVEIGGVELLNHVPTGRVFHQYVNPERDMPAEAEAVHGITEAFLADKPRFAEIAPDFAAFIEGATLVIHNAAFDMGFLNAEFTRHGLPTLPMSRALDTVAIARRRHPGSPANLDALCRRYGVDNSGREKHGALLDAELLAEVYLELIGGRQPGLVLATYAGAAEGAGQAAYTPPPRPRPLPDRITPAEAEAHAAFVSELGQESLWRRFGG